MKKPILVLAALAAFSAPALANDFAATLHYPDAPKSVAQTRNLDQLSTGSISRDPVSVQTSKKQHQDKTVGAKKR
ncbi:hypothetical protein GA830_17655 [Mesorhizobium sp. NBSH29]|uniref:hypothetical protein n=1 Tax=Mesorhizobium sp. NBSH29 TaxID=2654249 RepID=UPI0018967858|nr:hypothetical protein [Mesorhizobium sp. NBSH29]QPC88374.1 hypothetical protein GA830_17655 [Mesorhizobium sp. NBSH29]